MKRALKVVICLILILIVIFSYSIISKNRFKIIAESNIRFIYSGFHSIRVNLEDSIKIENCQQAKINTKVYCNFFRSDVCPLLDLYGLDMIYKDNMLENKVEELLVSIENVINKESFVDSDLEFINKTLGRLEKLENALDKKIGLIYSDKKVLKILTNAFDILFENDKNFENKN